MFAIVDVIVLGEDLGVYYSKVIKVVYYQGVIFWRSIHLVRRPTIFFFQIN